MYTVPCSVLHLNAEELSSNEAHIIIFFISRIPVLKIMKLGQTNSCSFRTMSVEEILQNDKNLI